MLTGKTINAAEAEKMGLVSRVVPVDKTLATAIEVAQTIARTYHEMFFFFFFCVDSSETLALS